jgi:hypothetical protein
MRGRGRCCGVGAQLKDSGGGRREEEGGGWRIVKAAGDAMIRERR